MAELKTKPTDASVEAFLGRTAEGERKRDCFAVLKMMQQVTKAKPRMWGASIVGFGSWQYKSGAQEADWPVVAFSPRKQNLTPDEEARNLQDREELPVSQAPVGRRSQGAEGARG
jgi:hypothetical protein